MKGIGCRGRFSLLRRIIISKELGAGEVFLSYEESLLERNWVQRKNFLLYEKKNHYWDGIGCRGRISTSIKNDYWEEIGSKERISSYMKNHYWEGIG
jgi:hypothetical protein